MISKSFIFIYVSFYIYLYRYLKIITTRIHTSKIKFLIKPCPKTTPYRLEAFFTGKKVNADLVLLPFKIKNYQ